MPAPVSTRLDLSPNWSVAAEYNHIFLDNHDAPLTDAAGGLASTIHAHRDVDMGLVRLNYRWGGPAIAKY
jgi:outer membrane immunogenic protein